MLPRRFVDTASGSKLMQLVRSQKEYTIQFARSTAMDLSGAAASNVLILHTSSPIRMLKGIILYTEATSADAGVNITIGKESDADYYYTGDSETFQPIWSETQVTLLQSDVGAGDTVICGCAGGKVGIGEVVICIEYISISSIR